MEIDLKKLTKTELFRLAQDVREEISRVDNRSKKKVFVFENNFGSDCYFKNKTDFIESIKNHINTEDFMSEITEMVVLRIEMIDEVTYNSNRDFWIYIN